MLFENQAFFRDGNGSGRVWKSVRIHFPPFIRCWFGEAASSLSSSQTCTPHIIRNYFILKILTPDYVGIKNLRGDAAAVVPPSLIRDPDFGGFYSSFDLSPMPS